MSINVKAPALPQPLNWSAVQLGLRYNTRNRSDCKRHQDKQRVGVTCMDLHQSYVAYMHVLVTLKVCGMYHWLFIKQTFSEEIQQ